MLGRVVGGDALDGRDDDVAGLVLGVLAGAALDRAGDLDRVVLGLLADRLDEDALRVLGGHVRDALEGRDLLTVGAGKGLACGIELALAVEELAIALFEHVAALIELLVSSKEPALEPGELGAASSPLFLGFALHPELLVLGLEDEFLLAGTCLCLDAPCFGGRSLHRLRGPQAAQQESCDGSADDRHDGDRHDGQEFHIRFLPSDRFRVGRA